MIVVALCGATFGGYRLMLRRNDLVRRASHYCSLEDRELAAMWICNATELKERSSLEASRSALAARLRVAGSHYREPLISDIIDYQHHMTRFMIEISHERMRSFLTGGLQKGHDQIELEATHTRLGSEIGRSHSDLLVLVREVGDPLVLDMLTVQKHSLRTAEIFHSESVFHATWAAYYQELRKKYERAARRFWVTVPSDSIEPQKRPRWY
jgi:hypothetical protein